MTSVGGKGAVITGGASGIGFATAKVLGRRGARVVLADIEEAALKEAVGRLKAMDIDAHGVECDVTSREDVETLANRAFQLLESIHIVFNNAGVVVLGPIAEMTHDEWRWVIDVDLWGPIHGVEVFVPRLIKQGQGGHMLFTSSFSGLVANAGLGPYCVAKYGVVALAEVLSRELQPSEIGVSVLCPMQVATNIRSADRNRGAEYGVPRREASVPREGPSNPNLVGSVLSADAMADFVVDAVEVNRLYVFPHAESREAIRRRFAQIDSAFDQQ